jgi:hypothetical protein
VYNQAKRPEPKYIEPAFVWVSTEVEA